MGIFGKRRDTPSVSPEYEQLTALVFSHIDKLESLEILGAQAAQFDPEATRDARASGLTNEDIGAGILSGWIRDYFEMKPNEIMWQNAYGGARINANMQDLMLGRRAWGHVRDVLLSIGATRGWTPHKP